MNSDFRYDSVRYPSNVFSRLRPDLIGATAMLHGVEINDVRNARVLELGCGDGASLLSIAHSFPNTECLGIDLAASRIEEARSNAGYLGLSNVKFESLDVMEADPESLGKFDFIVAHGLYSWIPKPVRERTLQVYKSCLAANGVGYLSYNVYPGWHLRNVFRYAGRFVIDGDRKRLEDAERALAFFRLAAGSPSAEGLYKTVLNEELSSIESKAPEVLFHDELAEVNQPFYFTELVDQLKSVGLDFVAESVSTSFATARLDPQTARDIEDFANDRIRREQLIDFMRGTTFRASLICHAEAEIKPEADPAMLDRLYFSGQVNFVGSSVDLTDVSLVRFTSPSGQSLSSNFPLIKCFLGQLSSSYPTRISFEEAVADLRNALPRIDSAEFDGYLDLFRRQLLELYLNGVISVSACEFKLAAVTGDRPEASRFVRWQLEKGMRYVTTPVGQNIDLDDPIVRELLSRLDGTKTIPEHIEGMAELVRKESGYQLPAGVNAAQFTRNCIEQFGRLGLIARN